MKTVLATLLLLLLIGGIGVNAATVEELYEEQLEASGGRELLEQLPAETQELLSRLGIEEPESLTELNTTVVWQQLWTMAAEAFREPLAVAGVVAAAILLYAWIDGLRHTLRSEETTAVFGAVCALVLCGSLLVPLSTCIQDVNEAMASVSVFMGSFTPVYAAVLLSGGRSVTALSFQSIVLYASQILSWLSSGVVVPLMTVSLALGVTGSVTPQVKLGGVGKLIGKTAVRVLTFGMMLFAGLLSLQSLTGASADNLGMRAMRFSIASFVPVVGGSLSETFSTIRGCLQLLRSTLGGFGMVATVLIILPPLLRCVGWSALLALCRTVADLFSLQTATDVLEAAGNTVKCLIGVLCACGSFLIIAVTVVTTAAGG